MSDDRFTYLHLPLATSLDDATDDTDHWGVNITDDRIDESIWEMLPPYQDEDDDSLLPSSTHPSYPYGSPYAPNPRGNRLRPSHPTLLPHPQQPNKTTVAWSDLALTSLLPGSVEAREADAASAEAMGEGGPTGTEQQQDAPPAPEADEEVDDEDDEDEDEDVGDEGDDMRARVEADDGEADEE